MAGSPLDFLNLSISLAVLFIVLLDPIYNSWNAPRIEIDERGFENETEKLSEFRFDILNWGRKPATDFKVEVSMILTQDNKRPNSARSQIVICKDSMLPPMAEADSFFRDRVSFNVIYTQKDENLFVDWIEEKEKEGLVTHSRTQTSPFRCDYAIINVAISWTFKDSSEFTQQTFTFVHKGKNSKPEIQKMKKKGKTLLNS